MGQDGCCCQRPKSLLNVLTLVLAWATLTPVPFLTSWTQGHSKQTQWGPLTLVGGALYASQVHLTSATTTVRLMHVCRS